MCDSHRDDRGERSNSGSAGSNQWPYTVRDDSITRSGNVDFPELTVDKAGSDCHDRGPGAVYAANRDSLTRA